MGIADLLDQLDIKEPLPSYSPTLYRITGGKGEAVALAQLIYKCGKGNWGTVRMSSSDWANELGLTRSEFENLNDCINLLELGTAAKCQIGTIKKIAYTLNKQAVLDALKDPHVEYSICRKQRINTLNSTYQHVENNVSTCEKQRINTLETTYIKDIKSNKSNEEIKEPLTETSSVVPQLFKSDTMNQEAAKLTERNKSATTKPKKPKEPTDELTAEIHKYFCQSYDYLKKWYEAKYESPMLTYEKDFKNLKGTFRNLIDGSVNLQEAKRYTSEKCFNVVKYFVDNFDKLDSYHQKKFSLNHIATNWNELKESIQKYQPPVAKPNPNEPVPYVKPPPRQETHNGNWLPLGMTRQQYIDLCIEVGREQILNGNEPEDYNPYEVTHSLHKSIINLTPDQVKTILNRYDVQ
jgi:hypothetical protein